MIVRWATLDDVDELARLRWDFAAEDGLVGDRDAFEERFRAFAHSALGQRWRAVCAEDGGRLVGVIWIGLGPEPLVGLSDEPAPAILAGVYVEPEYRSRGIGSQMMERLVDVEECDLFIVWPAPAALRFYQRHGFNPRRSPLARTRKVRRW